MVVPAARRMCRIGLRAHAGGGRPRGVAESPAPIEDLSQMSLQELANVQVTSVLKSAEPVSRAAAAIYVITHDEIVRSGATRLVDALRLAPNLRVTQLGSSSYTATSRGFGGNQGDQNFANKLLILIDGRTVYSPLFSGIYFDAQDVMLEDVERIEVISGPGATLWGANAVNGVINVITRAAHLTDGALLGAAGGNQQRSVGGRYGGNAEARSRSACMDWPSIVIRCELPNGSSAQDAGRRSRADSGPTGRGITIRSLRRGTSIADRSVSSTGRISCSKAAMCWLAGSITGGGSDLQVQLYMDQTQRTSAAGGAGFVLHTFDAEIQQSLCVGGQPLPGVWRRRAPQSILHQQFDRTCHLAVVRAHQTRADARQRVCTRHGVTRRRVAADAGHQARG